MAKARPVAKAKPRTPAAQSKPPANAPPPPTPVPTGPAPTGPASGPPGDDPAATDRPATDRPSAPAAVKDAPSWLLSLVVHLAAIIVLALWSLPQLPELTTALLLVEPSDNELDEFEEVPSVILDAVVPEEPLEEFQPETEVFADAVSFSTFDEAAAAPSFTEFSDLALTAAPPSAPTDLVGFDGTGTTGRGKAARTALVRRFGGSKASEEAVAAALNWLADHQNPDGTWSLVHDRHECNGRCDHPSVVAQRPDGYASSLRSGTGLALLPFLGAGQTPKQGNHRKVVARGLNALLNLAKREKNRPGASWRDSGNMYSHGIAAIVLTEAYGLTRDASLRGPAQAAVDYIIGAQHPEGGWRYRPGQAGDTSVTGWQIMALKSAYLSELSIPPTTIKRASAFLDRVQSDRGARYAYVPLDEDGNPSKPRATVSAVGLLCRMYLGWDRERPALQEGVAQLAKRGPSKNDFYYNYYAAQVLFQHTGGEGRVWRKWNRDMRQLLVDSQSRSGHSAGSWYVQGPHNNRGGRLYMTSLAAMSLEVYYRYLPIYKTEAVTREFPE